MAWATEDEVKAYVEKWNKPEIYDIPYDELTCHTVRVECINVADDISLIEPYSTDPEDLYNEMIGRAKEKMKQIEELNKKRRNDK